MKAWRSSLYQIALLAGLFCAGCFDFSRALDPCRVDPESEECLNASAGGGGLGSGGNTAGSGGDNTGGLVSGGSSGGPGTGGAGTGGDGSGGGSGGQPPTGARIEVSEIFIGSSGFVEIVNSGTAAASITGYSLGAGVAGPDIAASLLCFFKSAASLSPGEVAVAAKLSDTCDNLVPPGVTCIADCPFTLTGAATYYVFDADDQVVSSETYGSDGITPIVGQSWRADPPESGNFSAGDMTPGE